MSATQEEVLTDHTKDKVNGVFRVMDSDGGICTVRWSDGHVHIHDEEIPFHAGSLPHVPSGHVIVFEPRGSEFLYLPPDVDFTEPAFSGLMVIAQVSWSVDRATNQYWLQPYGPSVLPANPDDLRSLPRPLPINVIGTVAPQQRLIETLRAINDSQRKMLAAQQEQMVCLKGIREVLERLRGGRDDAA